MMGALRGRARARERSEESACAAKTSQESKASFIGASP